MRWSVGVIVWAGSLAALSACSGDHTTAPTVPSYGLATVQLTAGPQLPDSVRAINLFVVRIDIRPTVADSAAAATGAADDSATIGGWTTVAEPNVVLNLGALLQGQVTTLGQGVVSAGPYLGLRLVIDPSRSNVTLTNGVVLTAQSNPGVSLPNVDRYGMPVQLLQPVDIAAQGQLTIAVDFDAVESFVARGSSVSLAGMMFTPAVRATVGD